MSTIKYKYPRTFHLPWSMGRSDDDKVLKTIEHFTGKQVIVTEKLDGENTTIAKDYTHARSLDSSHHHSRDWLKSYWSTINFDIPDNFRICGEYLYAQHSIVYKELKSFFYAFSVWENDNCLSWNDTVEWLNILNIETVPVLWKGVFEEKELIKLSKSLNLDEKEGYVVRLADSFAYSDFSFSVAKFVRENHVQTGRHWIHKEIKSNFLNERA